MTYFDNLEQFGGKPCLIDEIGGTFTYDTVSRLCDEVSEPFAVKKTLVVIECENRYESVVGYLSVLRAKSTALLVNENLASNLKKELIGKYKPHYVWRRISGDVGVPLKQLGDYGLFACDDQEKFELHPSLALLLSTSGSTGSPKFVRLSAKNIASNAESIAQYLKLKPEDRPITTLPMAYSYGLSVINSHLQVGAPILLTNSSLMIKPFWTFFREQKATSLAGVPYTYEMLLRLRLGRMELPSLCKMTQAGGKLSIENAKAVAKIAKDKGIQFYMMYGQTEASARISYLPYQDAEAYCGSIGKAIPGGKLTVVKQGLGVDGDQCVGELVYEGPNVMMGYAEGSQDLSLGDELGGILHTGDIGIVDTDGYYRITGRLKRIIKLYGNRLNLDDLDAYLEANGVEGVCGGVDDHLKVAIVGEQDGDAIKKMVVSQFKFDHRSVELFRVSEIPRNASGKIMHSKLFKGVDQRA